MPKAIYVFIWYIHQIVSTTSTYAWFPRHMKVVHCHKIHKERWFFIPQQKSPKFFLKIYRRHLTEMKHSPLISLEDVFTKVVFTTWSCLRWSMEDFTDFILDFILMKMKYLRFWQFWKTADNDSNLAHSINKHSLFMTLFKFSKKNFLLN